MRLLFMGLIVALPMIGHGQARQGQARIDSLLAEVPKMKEDTNGVKLLTALAFRYSEFMPQEALPYATRGLALAKKIAWKKGIGNAYDNLGNTYMSLGDEPAALEAYYTALRVYEEIKFLSGIESVTGNIGNVFLAQGKPAKALEYHFKDLKLCIQLGNKENEVIERINIAACYLDLKDAKRALEYAQEAARQAGIGGYATYRADALSIMGDALNLQKNYASALQNHFDALRSTRALKDPYAESGKLSAIGKTYYLLASDSNSTKADSLVPPSRNASLQRSIQFLEAAMQLHSSLGMHAQAAEDLDLLAKAHAAIGNYKQAFSVFERSTALKDSIFSKDNDSKIAALETRRALQLKDKDIQIARLKKRNERLLFVAGLCVALLLIVILFRNYKKQRQSNTLLSQEKQRSDDLLLNILPAEVAEELKSSGGAQAKQYEEVTVLFTDFVNFTGTAEKLTPTALVRELHECFTAFDAIMERNGLEKIKTIGDAYLAVCGLPVKTARHADQAVQAAFEILDFMEQRGKKDHVFSIRIGIHSGPVVAGIVGVKKFAYDIWGDTVNTAARMEQNGEAGRINISAATRSLLRAEFPCTYRGEIAAKGKGTLEMYFVERHRVGVEV